MGFLSKPFKWAERQLFGSGPPNTYGGEIARAGRTAGGYADTANQEYLDQATSFDPREALAEAAGGLYEQFSGKLGQDITTLRGRQAGTGRLRGGYGVLDEAETVYNARQDLNSKLASSALQAEQLALQNQQGLAQFGQGQQGTYLDSLSSERDAETARYNARQSQRGQFFGAVGKLAGAVAGGPIGGAIAGKLFGP